MIQLCRNEFPDNAVEWLDAVAAVTIEGNASYSPLLGGTGGNLGSQELSKTYLEQTLVVLQHRDSSDWLQSALDGRERASFPKGSPGQFDPGGAGAPDDDRQIGNPWTFLFVVEGTLLFASSVVRRFGAEHAGAAWPFQVTMSAAGFASAAQGENPRAELWAPEWGDFLSVPEVANLLREGRADWNSHSSRAGVDMARAAATLGVDRGINSFQRYIFVNRLGQNPVAVPAGRVKVGVRGGVDLLAELDRWRDALRRSNPPASTADRLRALDQQIFDHAGSGAPADLAEVFLALGRCRASASRSGTVRAAKLPHLRVEHGRKLLDWLGDAVDRDRELRISLAFATCRDGKITFETLLNDPPFGGGLVASLADIARRRAFPLATHEAITDHVPAVRGPCLAFRRGVKLRAADAQAFVEGAVDDRRVVALTLGLSCVDWQDVDGNLPGAPSLPDPVLDILLPFTSTQSLNYTSTDGEVRSLSVRPGHDWPGRLIAGHIADVLEDATRRLRIAGVRDVVSATAGAPHDGARIAAALLLTTTPADRRAALERVAVIGSRQFQPPQEVTT